MKFILIYLLVFISNLNLYSKTCNKVDSNFRRFSIEIGNCYLNMIGNDDDWYKKSLDSKLFSITGYFHQSKFANIQYCNLFVPTQYYINHIDNPSKMIPGSTLKYVFNILKVNFGNSFKYRNMHISPYFSFNRRFGFGEEFFVDTIAASIWGEYLTSRSEYRSNGIGAGLIINYIIKNRISIGIEGNYNYNFEKIHPQPGTSINPSEYGFSPTRKSSLFHFKLGYLLF